MRRVLPATPAEFLDLQPIRSGFSVLRGRIIPLFAITALQRNDLSGHSAPSFFLCGAGALAREKLSELRSAWTAEGGRPYMVFALLHNLADGSCSYRVPAFADGKAQAFLHRHRRDQLNHQLYVVSRHHHLGARGKLCHSGDIRRAQIKLRAISLEERRGAPPLFFSAHDKPPLEPCGGADRTTL